MSVIMGLLVVSALAGLVLGFYFELAALAVSGLILSISAAMILQKEDFGFLEGIAIIALGLTVNQIAYLMEPRSGGPIRYRYPVTNLTMIQAREATRTLPASRSSKKRPRCGLFQRANDGGPFRQILRCERPLACRFIWFNEGECFVVSTARPAPSSRFEGAVALGNPCPVGARSRGLYRLGFFSFCSMKGRGHQELPNEWPRLGELKPALNRLSCFLLWP